MLYQEMWVSQGQRMEIRRQVKHNRLEARLAQARLSNDAALQETLPYMSSRFAGPAWQIESWQGAGW
jgi:hypothetical protein